MVAASSRGGNPVIWCAKLPPKHWQALDYKEVFSILEEMRVDCDRQVDVGRADIASEIRELKIRNFYGCARRAVGASNHVAMQRKFDPLSFKKDQYGHVSHSKKWLGYQSGRNFPEKRTIAKVEQITGVKLAQEFDLLLWTALDLNTPQLNLFALFAKNTPKKLFNLAAQFLKKLHLPRAAGDLSLYEIGDKICERVELQTLAVLILLHREAQRLSDKGAALTLGTLLFQMLIMLGVELQQRNIASRLYAFVSRHIFFGDPYSAIDSTPSELSHMASAINLLAFSDEGQTLAKKVPLRQRAEKMCLLRTGLHWILPVGDIVFTPLHRESPSFPREYATSLLEGRIKTWRTLVAVLEGKDEYSDVHESMNDHGIYLDLVWQYRFGDFISFVKLQASSVSPTLSTAQS